MGLQIWIPFKKNFNNYGLCPVQPSSEGPRIVGSDTFAHCCQFVGWGADIYDTDELYYTKNFSFATWLYPNFVGSSAEFIFTVGRVDYGNYRGYGIQLINNNSIGVWVGFTMVEISITANTWNHVAVVVNTNNTFTVYINGNEISRHSYTPPVFTAEMAGLGIGCFRYSGGNIYPANCYLSDFRIYDHQLSTKEIKELNKGLLLHYPLDNPYETGLVNKYNAPQSEGKYVSGGFSTCTKNDDGEGYNYKLTYTGNGNNNWLSIDFGTFSFTAGKTYIWSFKVRVNSSNMYVDVRSARIGNDWEAVFANPVDPSNVGKGWIEYYHLRTLQAKSTRSGTEYDTNPLLEFYTGNLADNGTVYTCDFDIKDVMVCEVDHYIPFIDNRFRSSLISDVSGNGYDGTLYGATEFDSDTIRGKGGLMFKTSADSVYIPPIYDNGQSIRSMSASIWFKTNTMNDTAPNLFSLGANAFFRCRLASSTQIWYYCAIGSTTGVNNTISVGKELLDNVWHHVVFTFSDGHIKLYVDGKFITDDNKTSYGTLLICNNTASYDWVLAGYNNYSEKLVGSLCDFRIYGKELTAEDVRELYEVSEVIDDKGNIYAYEYIEDTGMKIDKTGVIKNPNIVDGLITITSISMGSNMILANNAKTYPADTYKKGSLLYVPTTLTTTSHSQTSQLTLPAGIYEVLETNFWGNNLNYIYIAYHDDASPRFVKRIAGTLSELNAKFSANKIYGSNLYEA